jgi:hypothetical protein
MKALKFRAGVLANNIVVIRGLGSSINIFENTSYEHTSSLQHWRTPSAASVVPFAQVPFVVDSAAVTFIGSQLTSPPTASVSIRMKCVVTCVVTLLKDVNITKLNAGQSVLSHINICVYKYIIIITTTTTCYPLYSALTKAAFGASSSKRRSKDSSKNYSNGSNSGAGRKNIFGIHNSMLPMDRNSVRFSLLYSGL